MARLRWWLAVPFAALALWLLIDTAAAQPQPPIDFWQFPELVQSKVFQRWWWAFQQRAYPLGDIPAGAKLRGLRQIEQAKAAGPAESEAVSGTTWFNIGPAPMRGGQIGAAGNTRAMSGRVTAIAVDPANANRWLIGAAQGGVWETRDAGVSWTAKTDAQASLAMGAIAFAPSNPTVIYAGTGEGSFSGDSYAGAGLLKSTDGGNTWTLLAADKFAKNGFNAIRVDPANPNSLLAATVFGRAGRDGGGLPSPPATGIFRSTDGGASWTLTRGGDGTDLVADPTNFSNQYAGIGDDFSDPNNALVRSTDGGQSWTNIIIPGVVAAQVGRISLAIAPSNPNTMYVGIQRAFASAGGSTEGALLGLFRTDNAWAPTPAFISVPQPPPTGVFGFCGFDLAFNAPSQQCFYDMIITVDPGNANTLYAGGIQFWKCTNCGASPTWAEISKTVSDPAHGIHVDQHASAWAGSRLIVGNDGGVWSTTDAGANWVDHNTTLSLTQFYDASIHPTDPNFALGGAQDNGTMKWTGTGAWPWIAGGDGAANAISSTNPNTNWAVSSQRLNIDRTTNGGASFIAADGGIDHTGAPFISRFEKCPANDNIFIAGTNRIWRTTNFFSAPSPSWVNNNTPGVFNTGISALAFAPSDASCGTYVFGSNGGSVGITANGGASWVTIGAGTTLPGRSLTDFAFHPTDPNTLYVTLSGFDEGTAGQPGHVFKTTNALAGTPAWFNVSPPVNLPHNTIVVDPTDPNTVYVGTDMGIWKSANGGGNWIHMGPEVGMPNVAVFDLKINAAMNRLVAFTHGRGAFVLSSTPPFLVSSVLPSSRSVQVGGLATVFALILNGGVATATGVNITLATPIPATFSAQTTDPATNQVTGPPNTPVDIPGGQSQTYVIAITPTGTFSPTDVAFNFAAGNAPSAPSQTGLNTLLFSSSPGLVPDIVALAATLANDGIVNVAGATGQGVFVVATVNVGAGATITASADTGGAPVPVSLSICQTNPATSVCLAPPAGTVTTAINANATPTFAIFVTGTGTTPFDPAKNRIFVRFKDAGAATRGSTSVAVRTQ